MSPRCRPSDPRSRSRCNTASYCLGAAARTRSRRSRRRGLRGARRTARACDLRARAAHRHAEGTRWRHLRRTRRSAHDRCQERAAGGGGGRRSSDRPGGRRTAPRSSGSGPGRSDRGRGRARSSPRRRSPRRSCEGRSSALRTSPRSGHTRRSASRDCPALPRARRSRSGRGTRAPSGTRAEAERRQIARAHDDVGLQLVDLTDRALEQACLEVRPPQCRSETCAMRTTPSMSWRQSTTRSGRPRRLLPWRRCGSKVAFSRHIVEPSLRDSQIASSWNARRSSTTTACGGTTSRTVRPSATRRAHRQRLHARLLPPRAEPLHRSDGHEAVPGHTQEQEAP